MPESRGARAVPGKNIPTLSGEDLPDADVAFPFGLQIGVVEKLVKGGRKVTLQGQQDCDRIAAEIYAKSQE